MTYSNAWLQEQHRIDQRVHKGTATPHEKAMHHPTLVAIARGQAHPERPHYGWRPTGKQPKP